MNKHLVSRAGFKASCSAAALVLGLMPVAAFAQDKQGEDCTFYTQDAERADCLARQDTVQEGDAATLPDTAAASSAEGQGIVVTGSRIRRSEFNSPDPIQIINPELEMQKGLVSTADIVQSSPLATGSTQITAAISSNYVTDGGTGTETINLRGLGAARTLTLLNGRRAGPAGTRGAVSSFDLNVLPSSIVQSVEILKTGASPVYGSDAIAGVVNLITKTDTNGIEMGGFVSVPEQGGGETYNINATWGKSFDRGHILISADYYRRNEIAVKDRDFFTCAEDYVFRPDGVTRADIIDPRTNSPRCNGTLGPIIRAYDYAPQITGTTNFPINPATGRPVTSVDIQFGDFGQYLTPLNPAANFAELTTPNGFFPAGYSAATVGVYNVHPNVSQYDSIVPSTERYTVYADGAFELTPNVEIYAEGIYNNRKNYVNGSRQLFFQQFTSDTILADAFGYCNGCSGDPINVGFTGDSLLLPVVVTDHFDQQTDVDYYRGVLGVRGELSFLPSWYYDAYGQYSHSDGKYTSDVIFQDAVDAAELRTASCVGTVTSIRGVPCIDINYTDPRVLNGDFTPEERAFLFGTDTGRTLYNQYTGEGSLAGNLFSLPYGIAKAAVGVQYRRDSIEDTPGPVTAAGNSWGLTSAGVTAGYTRTMEAYGELEIPILADLPAFRELTLSVAGRVTNVHAERKSDGFSSDSKGNWTYKVGLNWAVTDWLRFRGTYGTSYRSPALYEQFLANQTGFVGQFGIDPCTNLGQRLASGDVSQRVAANCQADGVPLNYNAGGTSSALIVSGGGVGFLKPETSTAKTASVVLTPKLNLWNGLSTSLAIDYFDVKVKGEISQLGAGSIVGGCYNSEFFPNEPLCDNFTRINDPQDPRNHQITTVYDSYLNIDSQTNKGFDVTARVVQQTASLGTFSLLAQMTWQAVDRFNLFGDTSQDYNGEAGDPVWTGNFTFQWAKDDTSFVYGMNVIGATSNYDRQFSVNGGACVNSSTRGGLICPVVDLPATFYHSASITQDIGDKFRFTLGVSNLFNTAPPRASTVASGIGSFGSAPVASQYDYFGRRVFVNATAKF